MFDFLRKKLPRRWQQSKLWERRSRGSQQRLAFDQKLAWQQSRLRKIPSPSQLKYLSSFFSARERFAVVLSIIAIIGSLGSMGFFFYLRFVEPIPANGGTYREAVVGSPLYINPVLATTNDVDLDLVHLIYSGLLTYDKTLTLQPDLASSWKVSDDQKTYTVTLRKDAVWQDGLPVTAEDVLFTYHLIQDPTVNSPLRVSLDGVQVKAVDDQTVEFDLAKPFRPFASVLTTGILPEHLWSSIPDTTIRLAELNIKPIGSGAWMFDKLEKDADGNLFSYDVKPFDNYYGTHPYLDTVSLHFFPDFQSAIDALNGNKVDGMSFVPTQLLSGINNIQHFQSYHLPLPEYTALFFNQKSNPVLQDATVRQAIAYSIDRQHLVDDALDGLGQVVNGPILPGMEGFDKNLEGYPYNPIEAQRLLETAGWKAISAQDEQQLEQKNSAKASAAAVPANSTTTPAPTTPAASDAQPDTADEGQQAVFRQKGNEVLHLTLTAVDEPETSRVAELLKNDLQNIGFKVDLDIVSVSTLTNVILPQRQYEALLYGHILNVIPDLYPFWHSTQIDYPGLNFAGFADKNADSDLETARSAASADDAANALIQFQEVLDKQTAAVFLYSPQYTYLLPGKLKGFDIDRISIPSDRFNNVAEWYLKTKQGWKK